MASIMPFPRSSVHSIENTIANASYESYVWNSRKAPQGGSPLFGTK